jgi:hypothetical protein
MISKSFGLLFYLKKHHGDANVHRPIYLRITIDGALKEMSIHRSWDPKHWDVKAGRAVIDRRPGRRQPDQLGSEAQALNDYLDTPQAKELGHEREKGILRIQASGKIRRFLPLSLKTTN